MRAISPLVVSALLTNVALASDGFVMNLDAMQVSTATNIARATAAAQLGATHFNIPIPLCQSDRYANQMRWCNETKESETYASRLRALIQGLHQHGWTVGLFPFLMADDGTWRGNFEPQNFDRWSSTYLERLFELAEWTHGLPAVTDFIVGSELTPLYKRSPTFWRKALSSVRKATGYRTFVVANWDAVDAIHFWDASDYIGTSSYFPLAHSLSDDTSVAALAKRWEKWSRTLLALSRKTGRKLYFAELGYSSRTDAARRPWDYSEPADLDLDLQSRLFLAFSQAWSKAPELARFTIWALDALAAPLKDIGFGVMGKPAAAAVALAFQSRRSTPNRLLKTPVLFTMDDLPMWFVTDTTERVRAFQKYRALLASHAIPAVGFINTAFINDSVNDHRERDELRRWMDAGITLGNHTAHHLTVSTSGEQAFLMDVDAGAAQLDAYFPGWSVVHRLFRFPSLEIGAQAELVKRGYQILDATLDTRDWSWSEAYHRADAQTRARITSQALATIASQYSQAATHQKGTQPLTLLLHSTEFMRDHLEDVITLLESLGARWAGVPLPRPVSAQAVVNNVDVTRNRQNKAVLQPHAIR